MISVISDFKYYSLTIQFIVNLINSVTKSRF